LTEYFMINILYIISKIFNIFGNKKINVNTTLKK